MILPQFHNIQDLFGNTPLHYASLHGNQECVKILLSEGSNIETVNKEGWKARELT